MKSCLIICGSTNRPSKNFFVTEFLNKELDCKCWYFSKDKHTPFITDDLLKENFFPEHVFDLYIEIQKVESVILVLPEHNWNFSAFFKNILDWLSIKSIEVFKDKTITIISASDTQRTERFFQKIIENTFSKLGAKNIFFINWNNFEKTKESYKPQILGEILKINE